jgi:hypothetical protein
MIMGYATPLAEISADGSSSLYPSLLTPLLVIVVLVLAWVLGGRRFAAAPKKVKVVYWCVLGIALLAFVARMLMGG